MSDFINSKTVIGSLSKVDGEWYAILPSDVKPGSPVVIWSDRRQAATIHVAVKPVTPCEVKPGHHYWQTIAPQAIREDVQREVQRRRQVDVKVTTATSEAAPADPMSMVTAMTPEQAQAFLVALQRAANAEQAPTAAPVKSTGGRARKAPTSK